MSNFIQKYLYKLSSPNILNFLKIKYYEKNMCIKLIQSKRSNFFPYVCASRSKDIGGSQRFSISKALYKVSDKFVKFSNLFYFHHHAVLNMNSNKSKFSYDIKYFSISITRKTAPNYLFTCYPKYSYRSLLNGKNAARAFRNFRFYSKSTSNDVHHHIYALKNKKRIQRKKRKVKEDSDAGHQFGMKKHHTFLTFDADFFMPSKFEFEHKTTCIPSEFQIIAFATADEYDLELLSEKFHHQGLYTEVPILPDSNHGDEGELKSNSDVIHLEAAYQLTHEARNMFIFREGSVVFWNVPFLERQKILKFIDTFAEAKYDPEIVQDEAENFIYTYTDSATRLKPSQNLIFLNTDSHSKLEKFAFSNALAMSVKLGIWEASLEKYIDSIEHVTEGLRTSGKVVLTQREVLQKMGQLFALRHLINLSSDLLDTPDFYWENTHLEKLYNSMTRHLNIQKRTGVMNVKLSHCLELMELLKGHLNESHSSRIYHKGTWYIPIEIFGKVFNNFLDYLGRFSLFR